jgi:colicin import membrane protein
MLMKLKLATVLPNPFRDFGLYPYDEEQVQRLQKSIHELGFFSGVTARPIGGGKYQLAAGHHRIKAAEREKLTEIEAVVEKYDDLQMVAIMTVENLTQRGYNAASVLDSVAAHARIIAKDILLGEGEFSKFLENSRGALGQAQKLVAQHGPGMPLLYRAMNHFSKEDRKANKDIEIIKSTEIDHALSMLKNSGKMGDIVAGVYAEIEAIRAERQTKIDAERKTAEEAERKAEEKRQFAEKVKREAEEKAATEAIRRRKEAEEAEKKKAADAEHKRREAEKAEAEAKRKRKDREAREAENREKREAATKAKVEQDAKDRAERERQAKEKDAVAAQKKLEAVYDVRCANVFRLTSHEAAFRESVLSENGRRFIPRDKQLELAQFIRADIDKEERRSGRDLGSSTIQSMVGAIITKAIGLQRDIDEQERQALLVKDAVARVEKRWTLMRQGLQQAENALGQLAEDQQSWPYDKHLFPIDLDAIERLTLIGNQITAIKKRLGL